MSQRQPNVIFVFTDQQRHDTTGVHGCPLGLTPVFDRLAARGTDLHHCFTPNPVCGPARASLQTGQYASVHGVYRNGLGLPRGTPTLASCFSDAGYRTAYIGKWHLSHDEETAGPVRHEDRGGYQDWLAANLLEFTSDAYHTRLWDGEGRSHDLPGYRVDALTDAAIRYLGDHTTCRRDQPLFLFLSYLEPHHQNHADDYPPPMGERHRFAGSWTPPDLATLPAFRTDADSDDATHPRTTGGSAHAHLGGYYAMVARLDAALGRLMDAMRSLDLLDDTIVVFTSDHGCHFKTRNSEYKRSCHEASIRVPGMIVGGPFTGGGRRDELISLLDLPPSLLEACGIQIPVSMQGRSILPLLRTGLSSGEAWPEDHLIQISEDRYGRALRTSRWKYGCVAEEGQTAAPSMAGYREAYLYDLWHDPYELQNLVGLESYQRVQRELRGRLVERMVEVGEPRPSISMSVVRPSGQRSPDLL